MSEMIRVTRVNKCPICDHDTWCLIGKSCVICMRTVSPKSKVFKGGEVGYIHPHPDPSKRPIYEPKPHYKVPQVNVTKVLNEWCRLEPNHRLEQLATVLGVSNQSLRALQCTRAPYKGMVWGFPMKDGYGNRIGIRLRSIDGAKWAVKGSQAGIFIPDLRPQSRMLVVEGPTDTAAGVDLGFYTVGRPSCSGGVTHVVDHVKRARIKDVVIVADNDEPGIKGAAELQRWLRVPSCVLLLPTKDLREFCRIGDKSTLDSMIEQLVWTQPTSQHGKEKET